MAQPRGRSFQPGNTASTGRPPGSGNRMTQAVQALFAQHGEAVAKKCLAEALRGDTKALSLCLERVLPPLKSTPVEFDFPEVKSLADLPVAANAIMQAVAKGQLTPDQGNLLIGVLSKYQELLVAAGISERVSILEELLKSDGSGQGPIKLR